MLQVLKQFLPGIALAAVVATAAAFLATPTGIHILVLALLLGVILGNFKLGTGPVWSKGLKFSSSSLLETSIVLAAFAVDYKQIFALGFQTMAILICTMVAVLVFTFYLSRWLKCPGQTGYLIGFGTAICGSSAIAALAPGVAKDKSEIGLAMAVVNILGVIGMVFLPLLAKWGFSNAQMALLLGASLHSVANVAGAGALVNSTVAQLAITIKMARVALLSPALILFSTAIMPRSSGQKIKVKLPWYLIAFIAVSIAVIWLPLPNNVNLLIKKTESILLSMSMAAIGVSINLRTLITLGRAGIAFGMLVFIFVITILLASLYLL